VSKGSRRRPKAISDEQLAANGDAAFGKGTDCRDIPTTPDVPTMCQSCGQPPSECHCISLNELARRMGIKPWQSNSPPTEKH
jgi:hypothetical protein